MFFISRYGVQVGLMGKISFDLSKKLHTRLSFLLQRGRLAAEKSPGKAKTTDAGRKEALEQNPGEGAWGEIPAAASDQPIYCRSLLS